MPDRMRGGVDQPEGCVCPDAQACDVRVGMNPGQNIHPGLYITALKGADLGLVCLSEAGEITVLYPDDIRIAQGEVHLEFHQGFQGVRWAAGFRNNATAALQEVAADTEEQFTQNRLFSRKVPVHRRSAYTGRGSQVFQGYAAESVVREESGCG